MAIKAGIDIGTNTILLLVAQVSGGHIKVLEDHVRVVRLGQGVDKNRAFSPEALARARGAFREYSQILKNYPGVEIRAAATSGSRDARNSAEFFREVEREFGIPVRVISGEEEAELSFRGALPQADAESMAVLDIGGGSTEIVGYERGALFRFSFQMGCVRLTERFFQDDPPTASQIQELKNFVTGELEEQAELFGKVKGKALIGVAGTATYLASSSLGLAKFDPDRVHGATISGNEVSRLVEEFSRLTAAQRLGIGGMDRGRADVILAGGLILEAVLGITGHRSYMASVRGLRFGLVL